ITGDYLKEPVQVHIEGQSKPAQNIRQRYLQVTQPWKLEAMTRLLETENTDGIIAFVRTRNMTEELTSKLVARGFAAAAISGDIPQHIREKTVEDLRAGRIDILVATDVAARGLDVNASATSSTTTSRMIRHPMYTGSDVPAVLDGK